MPEASGPIFRVPISRRNTRLSRRLIACMVAFSSALTLVITAYQLTRDYDRDLRLIESRMQQIQYVHLDSLVDTLWATNTKKLQIQLDGILRLPDMQYVGVKEGDRLWASAGTLQSDDVVSRKFPMNYVHQGRTVEIGTLSVVASLDGVYQRLIDKTLIILLGNGIKTFLVAGFMLFIFQYLVTRHLDTLARYARSLDLTRLPESLRLNRISKGKGEPDELDEVAAAINDMRADLEESYEALRESEERYRRIYENTPAMLHSINWEGRLLSVSDHWLKVLGYGRDEVIGQKVMTFMTEESARQAANTGIPQFMKAGLCRDLPLQFVNKNGQVIDVLLSAVAEQDEAGEFVRSLSVLTDITERKRAEEALRESEERFRLLLDSTGEAIYGLDTDGNCTFANPACARFLGYGDPADFLGQNMHDLIHHTRPDGTPYPREACRIYQSFIDGEGIHVDDEVLWRPDGTSFPAEYRSFPVRRAGEIVGAVVTFVDVTEREEAQAQLIQATKLATLGEMASGIAHEINQPLSVIGMAAELSLMAMEKGEFDTELVRKKLQTIVGQRGRMAEIIDHIRLFSRTDNAKLESFNPVDAVAGGIRLIEQQFRAAGIELEEDLPADCRNVSGHPLRLEQVVLNLLANARDAVQITMESAASAAGAYVPKVRVSVVDDKRRKTVVISVFDNGGGIPEEALERIFDPFFTTKTEGEGTGLGLSISYSIVDGMGGRIEAKNTDGGAMFRITLPVSADQPAAVDSPPKRKRAKPRPGKAASTLPRIIFVDDEKDIVEEVAEYLVYEGYDVATAGNGWEALKLHQSHPADMVITDWLMPGMGGDELIRRLRRTYPDLPIMVITGHTTFGEEQDIVAHGASVVMKKPIDLHELTEHMRQMVGP